jgi:hypothetical protein
VLSLSSRQTIAGNTLKSATTAHFTAIAPIRSGFEPWGRFATCSMQYADPVSDQHLQDSIPQNGRTFRIGLRWKIGTK